MTPLVDVLAGILVHPTPRLDIEDREGLVAAKSRDCRSVYNHWRGLKIGNPSRVFGCALRLQNWLNQLYRCPCLSSMM